MSKFNSKRLAKAILRDIKKDIEKDLDKDAKEVQEMMKEECPVWNPIPNDNRKVVSGKLKDSIQVEKTDDLERLIGPDESVEYTKYVVEGRSGGKRIAGKGKLLKWYSRDGQVHYAKEVTQGSQDPQDFISSTFKKLGG